MTKIAILGANGRLGRVVAKAFIDAGFDVRAVTRTGMVPAELEGATAVAGDALDRQSRRGWQASSEKSHIRRLIRR